jgi:hypothetical protein
VLAVVDHQQPDPALQGGGDTVADTLAWLLGDAQHRGDRVGHRRWIGDRCQLEKPDPVGKFTGQLRCDLQRQARLADPAHPGQRHQPVFMERRFDLVDLGLAPHETGRRTPQVARTCVQRPQRRKLGPQALRLQLKHRDRVRHVPQPSRPEVQQIHAAQQSCCGVGHQDLTAMPGGHHPCSPVEHRAEVVPVPQLSLAGRQPHPHRQPQRPLCSDRSIDSRRRRSERGDYTVPGVAEQEAAMLPDHCAQHLVMRGQCLPHRSRVGFPPTGRTLNIGE